MAMTAADFLASKGVTVPENTLAQYGVLGMKWGVRKDRSASVDLIDKATGKKYPITYDPNKAKVLDEGILTSTRSENRSVRRQMNAIKKQMAKDKSAPAKAVKRSAPARPSNTFKNKPSNRRMSDAELRAKINRLQMEKQLRDLTAPTPHADHFVKQLLKDSGKQAARTVAQRAVAVSIDMAFAKAAGGVKPGTSSKAFLDAMAKAGKKGAKN